MLSSDRYFEGRRQVLVQHHVKSAIPNTKDEYMKLCKKEEAESDEKFVTHHATIIEMKGNDVIVVDPRSFSGEFFKVNIEEIERLNNPHIFKKDILGNLVFEDDLKCSY